MAKDFKRILALVIATVMLMSLVPVVAFADEPLVVQSITIPLDVYATEARENQEKLDIQVNDDGTGNYNIVVTANETLVSFDDGQTTGEHQWAYVLITLENSLEGVNYNSVHTFTAAELAADTMFDTNQLILSLKTNTLTGPTTFTLSEGSTTLTFNVTFVKCELALDGDATIPAEGYVPEAAANQAKLSVATTDNGSGVYDITVTANAPLASFDDQETGIAKWAYVKLTLENTLEDVLYSDAATTNYRFNNVEPDAVGGVNELVLSLPTETMANPTNVSLSDGVDTLTFNITFERFDFSDFEPLKEPDYEVIITSLTKDDTDVVDMDFDTESRPAGFYAFQNGGLRVWTENNGSADNYDSKSAAYIKVDMLLLDMLKYERPKMVLDPAYAVGTTLPGFQLRVDLDGDGAWDTTLVREVKLDGSEVYSLNAAGEQVWWGNNTIGTLPSGGGYPFCASLEELCHYNPDIKVVEVGYSLGSGIIGDFVINSMTYGDTKYSFEKIEFPTPPLARTVVEITPNNLMGLDFSASGLTGHNDFVNNELGINVWTESNTGTDKAAGYIPINAPDGVSLYDFLTYGQPEMVIDPASANGAILPGLQLLVDLDGNGTYAYLARDNDIDGINKYGQNAAGEEKWWSKNTQIAHFPGNSDYKFLESLEALCNYNPDIKVMAVGYSLGSGVLGDFVINSMSYGDTIYNFRGLNDYTFDVVYKDGASEVLVQPVTITEGQKLTASALVIPTGYELVSAFADYTVLTDDDVVVPVKKINYNVTIDYTYNNQVVGSQTIVKTYREIVNYSDLMVPSGYFAESFSPIYVTGDAQVSVPVRVIVIDNSNDNDNNNDDDNYTPSTQVSSTRPATTPTPTQTVTVESDPIPLAAAELEVDSYVSGFEDGNFYPDAPLTRAQLSSIFYGLYGNNAKSSNGAFPDVTEGHWAFDAIAFMKSKGFLSGYEDGTFKPDQQVTRAEVATVIALIANLEEVGDATFTDIEGHWAAEFIKRLYAAGLISGYADGTFRPDQSITRAEMIIIVNLLEGRTNVYDKNNVFADVTEGHWAYAAIMNAANGYKGK